MSIYPGRLHRKQAVYISDPRTKLFKHISVEEKWFSLKIVTTWSTGLKARCTLELPEAHFSLTLRDVAALDRLGAPP